MLEKITFEKKLGIDSREPKYRGLKVITVSFLFALVGFLLFLTGFETIGRLVIYISFIGVLGGLIFHIFLLFLNMESSQNDKSS